MEKRYKKIMKYLSLFSGIGGFELGIIKAYADIRNNQKQEADREDLSSEWDISGPKYGAGRPEDTVCVGFSEVDPECDRCKKAGRGDYQPKTLISKTRIKCDTCGAEKEHPALQIYNRFFEDHENYGDITKINPDALPDFDLIVGGFPCQAFSIAGKRRGFEDTRGTLFFDIARILKSKRPRLLLLENVKGLLSHDNGRTFKTIISALAELGYDLQWQVLNSKNFGVPQNRERVFIIGHLRGTAKPEVFPIREYGPGNDPQGEGKEQTSFCITTREGQRQDPTAETYIANTISTRQNVFSRTQRRKHENLIARTITGGGHSGGLHSDMTMVGEETMLRRLTPTECERLQGFPDGWTGMGFKEKYYLKSDKKKRYPVRHYISMSDSQRYKTLGNAVTVNVICEIVKRIIKQNHEL